jgi:hypothetical protein
LLTLVSECAMDLLLLLFLIIWAGEPFCMPAAGPGSGDPPAEG